MSTLTKSFSKLEDDCYLETQYGTLQMKENSILFDSNDGRQIEVTLEHKIKKFQVVGEFPIYVDVICDDGQVYSVEFPTSTTKLISQSSMGKIIDISRFPSTHNFLILLVDEYGGSLIFDHLLGSIILYVPSLPSQLITIEFYFPLSVLLFEYKDGRSCVWSLDTGSLLLSLLNSPPQERSKSTIIYQSSSFTK